MGTATSPLSSGAASCQSAHCVLDEPVSRHDVCEQVASSEASADSWRTGPFRTSGEACSLLPLMPASH